MDRYHGPIPRREPEVIRAEADRRYRGDLTKVATTSLRSIRAKGVRIISRYGKAEELDTMLRVVIAMTIGPSWA